MKKFQIELTGEEAVAVVKWIIERREKREYELVRMRAQHRIDEMYMRERARRDKKRAENNRNGDSIVPDGRPDADRRRVPAEDDTYDLCSKCGEPIIGEAYASMGGNIVPYIPAKLYHIRCVPSVTELLGPKKEEL